MVLATAIGGSQCPSGDTGWENYKVGRRMIYIAFDVEANGLINPDLDDPNYQPEIIEFGAVKWGKGLKKPQTISVLIKPENRLLEDVIKITGISEQDLEGASSFLVAHNDIAEFFTGVDHCISYNGLSYDLPVLMFNLRKYGLQFRFPWPRFHTDLMLAATDYLGMQGKTGNKSPKLVELYQELFGEGVDNAHRALDDAEATAKSFKELQKRGVI